jgi:hypothetical protein
MWLQKHEVFNALSRLLLDTARSQQSFRRSEVSQQAGTLLKPGPLHRVQVTVVALDPILASTTGCVHHNLGRILAVGRA